MPADLDLAHRLADLADAITVRHFTGRPIAFQTKIDGSPVSEADLEVELRVRAAVVEETPGDGFLGEEVGASGTGPRRWIVDGVDGTVNFVAGRQGWATLIALEVDGRVVVGVSTSPGLGRRWWASRGTGAWVAPLEGRTKLAPRRLLVSDRSSLKGARCSSVPPLDVLTGDGCALVRRLVARCEYVPPVTHAATMVAAGEVDFCVQLMGGPWDFAALAMIVEEAGGWFSDAHGAPRVDGGGPVIFSNARLHGAVLSTLSRLG